MRRKGRLLAWLLTLAMIFTMAGVPSTCGGLGTQTVNAATTTMTAAQIVKNMGLGWNIGNTLESNNNRSVGLDISSYETYWGNPAVTKAQITAVKNKGFNTVRVPVTWYEHITTSTSGSSTVYTIDSAWLNRVKEVVDYAYSQGMYVILNVHHENWINRSDFLTAYDSMSPELKQVWTQIATYFKDYDQHLIFEGMNEPRAYGTDYEWYIADSTTRTAAMDVINKLNADFVSAVRSVDSNYKTTRLLMIPSYDASSDSNMYKLLNIPDDAYVAVSIHAYSPYDFAMNESGDHSSFTDSYKASLKSTLSEIYNTFVSKGRQVVIGEFSASNFGYDDARVEWAKYYMSLAKQYGIPCVLWDNNVESNNGGEAHGYLNRSTCTWYSSGGKVVDALVSTLNDSSITWGEVSSSASYPSSEHKAYSAGSQVTKSGDSMLLYSSAFVTGKELAIKYSSAMPSIALMDSSWGGWTVLAPYDYDPTNKIAYFSCDTINSSWSSSSAIYYIKCIDTTNDNADVTITGGVLLDKVTSGSGSTVVSGNTGSSVGGGDSSDTTDTDTAKKDETVTETPTTDGSETEVTDGEASNTAGNTDSNTNDITLPQKKGTLLKDESGKSRYKVTDADSTDPEVAFAGTENKSVKTVTIPDTVTIDGVKYKVTSIADKAFKNDKKLTKVVIGKNIVSIGRNVFKGCTGLKTIKVKSLKLTSSSVSKKAFKGVNKKSKIKVPKSKKALYKKLFKKCGLPDKVKIG